MTKRPKQPSRSERSKYSLLAELCKEAVAGDMRNAGLMAQLFVEEPDRAAESIKRLKRQMALVSVESGASDLR